ncbi:hypothetical protein Q9247_07690 [Halomonas meridiana]|uniref:hypothetical protein n=1 Tax=Halomonadaceae TaxID=28256 RepID=UPI00273C8EA8|nr:hypothetical protein [Halomonas meridiana]MDP4557560.1 hypothetical protein [Halomonas meridiana]
MKLQLTTLAAAISLTVTSAALAQTPPNSSYTPPIITSTNLISPTTGTAPNWGADNGDFQEDNTQWESTTPGQNNFTWASGELLPEPLNPIDGQNKVDSVIDQNNTGTALNMATVSQDGATGGQWSRVRQDGQNLMADVDQRGSNNYSDVNQELSSGGIVNVLQEGDSDASRVEQFGGENNKADITQSGFENNSFVRQGGIGGGANLNDAHVVQTGTNNDSYIGQTHGDMNWAFATQNGTDGTSYIIQQGSDNRAELYQVDGTDNESYIIQNNSFGPTAITNYAYVQQSGDSNVSTVTQASDSVGNAVVYQSGGNNLASTLQY